MLLKATAVENTSNEKKVGNRKNLVTTHRNIKK